MQDTITHNTQLTLQNWGLTSAMQYDVSNIFLHMGLDHQPSQPYYQPQQYRQPEQEDNDVEDEEEDARGEIKICKIHTDLNVSDPLTKPLPQPKHEAHTRAIGIGYILD